MSIWKDLLELYEAWNACAASIILGAASEGLLKSACTEEQWILCEAESSLQSFFVGSIDESEV